MAPPKTETEENGSLSERSAKLRTLFALNGPKSPAQLRGDLDQISADDDLFELIVALLKWSRVMDDNVICMRLVEHLAEHVGYRCAGYADRSNVTELMLMASRASELAKKFPR